MFEYISPAIFRLLLFTCVHAYVFQASTVCNKNGQGRLRWQNNKLAENGQSHFNSTEGLLILLKVLHDFLGDFLPPFKVNVYENQDPITDQ